VLLAAVIGQLGGTGQLPDTGSVRQDLLDFFARRAQAAHRRQWERCMPALVEAAARHPELAAMIARLTAQALSRTFAEWLGATLPPSGDPPASTTVRSGEQANALDELAADEVFG
jgi:Tetracyclin repressor-like, C-terminal domain